MFTQIDRTDRAAKKLIDALDDFKAQVADLSALAQEMAQMTTNLTAGAIPEGVKPDAKRPENAAAGALASLQDNVSKAVGAGRGKVEVAK